MVVVVVKATTTTISNPTAGLGTVSGVYLATLCVTCLFQELWHLPFTVLALTFGVTYIIVRPQYTSDLWYV